MPPPVAVTCPVGTTFEGKFSALIGPLANDESGVSAGSLADPNVCTLPPRILVNTTLAAGNVYHLSPDLAGNGTIVGDGDAPLKAAAGTSTPVTLTIEPGVLVYGDPAKNLIVTRGAKLMAEGTAAMPIVFTGKQQLVDRFDGNPATNPLNTGSKTWGGIVISGRGKHTECTTAGGTFETCDVGTEGLPGVNNGGALDNDSSGVLKYLVVRNGGTAIIADEEVNGITFYSVGSGTVIDYIQVYRNDDDGIEFFGGAAFAAHAALIENADDSLDWGLGWRGGAQWVYVQQDPFLPADRAIEADSREADPFDGPPTSNPLLANLTLVGNKVDGKAGGGLKLRRGTKTQIWNSIVSGAAPGQACIALDTAATYLNFNPAAPLTSSLFFANSYLGCDSGVLYEGKAFVPAGAVEADPAIGADWVKNWYENPLLNNVAVPAAVALSPTGALPAAPAPGLVGKPFTPPTLWGDDAQPVPAYFMPTAYAGAFAPGVPQWTEGWTVGIHGNTAVWGCNHRLLTTLQFLTEA